MADLQFVKGLDDLKRRLDQIGRETGRKVLRSGVAAGARVVKNAAIAAAPVGSSRKGHAAGTLKRAAIIKFVPDMSNDTQVEYIVTFRKGKRQQKYSRDAFYASWVEFGHKIVPRSAKAVSLKGFLRNKRTLRNRRAAATGRVEPHRFLGPAFESSKQNALTAMVDAIKRGLDKLV